MEYRPHRYRSACGRLELFARDYAVAGEEGAPALLLMHGLTRNSADFEPLAEHVAGRYRLIVPDQRGRGHSMNDPETVNYRPDIYAQDMFALLEDLRIERAGLIGTSMGGLMAMVMCAMQPARVQAIVLNDIGPVLAPEGLARIGTYVGLTEPFAGWGEAAERCAAINAEAFPGFDAQDWLAFARRTCREIDGRKVEFAYDPRIAAAFSGEEMQQPNLWPLWQALNGKPVLVVRGALSDLLAPATAAEMAKRHEGPFTYVEVPGRGHAPLLDEPGALRAIEDFLAEHLT